MTITTSAKTQQQASLATDLPADDAYQQGTHPYHYTISSYSSSPFFPLQERASRKETTATVVRTAKRERGGIHVGSNFSYYSLNYSLVSFFPQFY